MRGDHKFRTKPLGSKVGGYRRRRIQIGFDDHTFETITEWAKKNNRSTAAQVRELVLRGLKSLGVLK